MTSYKNQILDSFFLTIDYHVFNLELQRKKNLFNECDSETMTGFFAIVN